MKKKSVYLELLRIIAITLVVYNHTRVLGFDLYQALDDQPLTYYVSMAFSVLCKCAVPVFFMISGAVLLGRQESMRDLLCRRILHFAFIWALFVFLQYLRIVRLQGMETFRFSTYLAYLYSGNIIEPYWYLPVYMGYLLMLPILRKLVKSLQRTEYLYLFALDGVFILVTAAQIFTGYRLNMSLALLSNTIVYPLAGYYLANILQIKNHRAACAAAVSALLAGVAAGCVLQQIYHLKNGGYTDLAAGAVTDIIAAALFVLVKETAGEISTEAIAGKIIVLAGSCVFGTYLIEDVVRNQYERVCVYLNQYINPMLSCWIFVLLSVMTSIVVILIINKGLALLRIRFRI